MSATLPGKGARPRLQNGEPAVTTAPGQMVGPTPNIVESEPRNDVAIAVFIVPSVTGPEIPAIAGLAASRPGASGANAG